MPIFRVGVGMEGWKPFEFDVGMDLLVCGQRWLHENREVPGDLHA